MSLYSRIKTWVNNEVLTASDLNAEFNNIITNSSADSMVGSSANVTAMQTTASPGTVGSESLASSITGELQRLRYMISYLASGNISNWYDHTGRNLKAGSLAVTRADMASLGQQLSSTSGSFSDSTGLLVDVTNLAVTITTSGRPVFVGVVSDNGISGPSSLGASATTATTFVSASFYILRNTTTQVGVFNAFLKGASSSVLNIEVPPGSIWAIDTPSAGTYTYKLSGVSGSNSSLNVGECKLIAYEIA